MSITLIEPTPPTMEEVEDTLTTLYYMQRVNFEAADEVADRARPLWAKVVKSRLSEVATTPDRNTRGHALYNRKWDAAGTIHERTKMLSVFLEADNFPEFTHDADDKAKAEKIVYWTELIGLSAEAEEADKAIKATGNDIYKQLLAAEALAYGDAAEMRGWYVTLQTSRRSTTGWVVGGTGKTVRIIEDPLAGIRRIHRNNGHSIKLIDKRVSASLAAAEETAITFEAEKYSLKTASISLIYPPDMATERREWVSGMLVKIAAARAKAKPVWEAFLKWKVEADLLTAKTNAYTHWLRSVPQDPIKQWTKNDGHLRWVYGASEALTVLFDAVEWDEAELRHRMIAEYQRRHPEQMLTPAEQAFLDAKPAGDENFSHVAGEVLRTDHPGLAPLF